MLCQLPYLPVTSVFVLVDVGTRDHWNDDENEFRRDGNLCLDQLPTLIELRSHKRLTGKQINEKVIRRFWEDNADEL